MTKDSLNIGLAVCLALWVVKLYSCRFFLCAQDCLIMYNFTYGSNVQLYCFGGKPDTAFKFKKKLEISSEFLFSTIL